MLRLLALLLVAFTLASPLAAAQTKANPILGTYQQIYVVAGRVVDSALQPVVNATITVTLTEPGVKAAPVRGVTNCNGDYIVYFELDDIRAEGSVKVSVDTLGLTPAPVERDGKLDPLFRRSDLSLQVPATWAQSCFDPQVGPFETRLTVTGRVINQTARYQMWNGTYDARPVGPQLQAVLMYYFPPGDVGRCPPGPNGGCERVDLDERGDFKYTFTYNRAVPANGTMLFIINGVNFTAPMNATTRLTQVHIDLSGRPLPTYETQKSPGLGVAPLAAVVVALALGRRLLPGKRG